MLSIQFILALHFLSVIFCPTSAKIFDVVIIGAGPAGIAAAIDLQKASSSISITILEARNRVGGRVYTDTYTFKDDIPADIGAQWIHAYGPENPLYNLHRQMQAAEDKQGDQYFDLSDPKLTGCYDTSGSSVSRQMCEEAQNIVEKLFSPKYNKTLKNRDVSIWDLVKPEYEKISEGQLKRLVYAMLIAREEYEAADLDQVSAKQTFFDDSSNPDVEEDGDDMALKRGFGSFIERIVKKFALPIQFNNRITHIKTSSSKPVEIITADNRIIKSKYVLITIPLGCLKAQTVIFEPNLPSWKQNAINSMGFGDMTKVILQFNVTFWNPQYTSFYIADAQYTFVISAPEKRMLVLLIGGSRARHVETSSDSDTLHTILNSLHSIFPNRAFKLERHRISRWGQDQYARGSYSYYALNTSIDTFHTLAKTCCHDQLFWAGEHTSPGGSVHTAFATGQREAAKIIQQLETNELWNE